MTVYANGKRTFLDDLVEIVEALLAQEELTATPSGQELAEAAQGASPLGSALM